MIDQLSFAVNITLVSGLLLLITGVFYAIMSYACKHSIKHPEPGKNEIFACGEDLPPAKAYVLSSHLYQEFWKGTFRRTYDNLRGAHSGDMGDWLWWALLYMAILIVLLLLVMR
jgi:hypothetical protein